MLAAFRRRFGLYFGFGVVSASIYHQIGSGGQLPPANSGICERRSSTLGGPDVNLVVVCSADGA